MRILKTCRKRSFSACAFCLGVYISKSPSFSLIKTSFYLRSCQYDQNANTIPSSRVALCRHPHPLYTSRASLSFNSMHVQEELYFPSPDMCPVLRRTKTPSFLSSCHALSSFPLWAFSVLQSQHCLSSQRDQQCII